MIIGVVFKNFYLVIHQGKLFFDANNNNQQEVKWRHFYNEKKHTGTENNRFNILNIISIYIELLK